MTVRCSEYKDCPNPECMHFEAHKPVEFEGERDCTSAATICPLVSFRDVICLPVEDNTVKVEQKLEVVTV